MSKTENPYPPHPGRYLAPRRRRRRRICRFRRCLTVTVLVCWDGLLLYMIVRCLIVPVYGGLFIALVSIYLGYQLQQEE